MESGRRPIHAGRVPSGCFIAAFVVGYVETLHAMHAVSDRHKGHSALSVDESGWRLLKC
jgi:hypothetical protein